MTNKQFPNSELKFKLFIVLHKVAIKPVMQLKKIPDGFIATMIYNCEIETLMHTY
jgi:hypothetical protein